MKKQKRATTTNANATNAGATTNGDYSNESSKEHKKYNGDPAKCR